MRKFDPKKTTNIYARVPDELKQDFKRALARLEFSEAFFMRAAAEALIKLTDSGEDLALPIRLMTVQEKQKRAKKK